jgi:hypothetical protein
MLSREPLDPFAPPLTSWDYHRRPELAKIILLDRICSNPELVDHYPHTRDFLERTQHDNGDLLRVSAKMAVERYFTVPV